MKIIIFSKSNWNIYNFRKGLINKLINNGYEIFIISSEDSYKNKLIELGCKIYPININNKKINPFFDFFLLFKIYNLYKKINPSIVLHFNIKPVIYGSFVASLLNIKHINMITGLGTAFISKKLIKQIVKFLYYISMKKSNLVFFQNLDDKDLFIKNKLIKNENTKLIPGSGIDLKYYDYKPYPKSDNIIFLLISRILWDKGIKEFIEAAKLLNSKYDNLTFQLLGPTEKGISSEISLQQIKIWEDNKIISYAGFKNDVRPYIEKSHCVVLPSYREGTPKSLLEGSSMGRPIIATNTTGCREVINDGINGYLCENKDYISLANTMEKFMKLSLEEKIKMGKQGRRKVEKEFDEKIVINLYLDSIKKITT